MARAEGVERAFMSEEKEGGRRAAGRVERERGVKSSLQTRVEYLLQYDGLMTCLSRFQHHQLPLEQIVFSDFPLVALRRDLLPVELDRSRFNGFASLGCE